MSAVLQEPGLRVRPMLEDDIDEILEIEHQVYEFPWTPGIFRDCLRVGYCCWVLTVDDKVAAYSILSVAAGESHLLNICVGKDYQRRGYATYLVEHMLKVASRHGANTCLLEVRPSNISAVGLYRKLGFVEVGTRRGYYPTRDGREDALILARELLSEEP